MSNRKDKKSHSSRDSQREAKTRREPEVSDEEDVIDLCDDHDYQVLSAVFETDSGKNVADILSRLQKDVHLLAVSVHQLIQLSLASQQVRQNQEESENDVSESEDEQAQDDQNNQENDG